MQVYRFVRGPHLRTACTGTRTIASMRPWLWCHVTASFEMSSVSKKRVENSSKRRKSHVFFLSWKTLHLSVQSWITISFQRLCSRLTALWRYINFVLFLLLLIIIIIYELTWICEIKFVQYSYRFSALNTALSVRQKRKRSRLCISKNFFLKMFETKQLRSYNSFSSAFNY